MPSYLNGFDKLSQFAARAGGAVIFLIAVMITVNTLCRKYFGITFTDAPEIAGYLFAIAVSFGYSFVFIRRQNVRIDTFYGFLPRRVAAVMDVAAALAFFLMAAMMTSHAVRLTYASWSANSRSVSALAFPLWIPQLAWSLGLALLCVTTLVVSVQSVLFLIRGKPSEVGRIAGLSSLDAELSEFTGDQTPTS